MTGRTSDEGHRGNGTPQETNQAKQAEYAAGVPNTQHSLTPGDLAAQINAEHQRALQHAGQAIDHARRAGELLLQVKASLGHGSWLPWLAANVEVTPRQAQRYMAAAQGKPIPVRAIKCDTVSHSDPFEVIDRHHFEADPLSLLHCIVQHRWGPVQTSTFVVEPATDNGFYFVTELDLLRDDGGATMDCLRRPIAARALGWLLHSWGAPAEVDWDRCPTDPVVQPFGASFGAAS